MLGKNNDDPTGESEIMSEREAPRTRRMTFGDSVDRIVVYLLAGLTAFLCITSLDNRDKLIALLEAKKAEAELRSSMLSEIKKLRSNDQVFLAEMQNLKIEAAKHGWTTLPTPYLLEQPKE